MKRLFLLNKAHGLCLAAILTGIAVMICACGQTAPEQEGRITIRYWEKWTGFEADAMRSVVADFNASQDRIYVDYTSVSKMERKLMLAIAGGVPPDVAGIYGRMVPIYAENNALMPLDRLAADAGIRRESYIDVFWQICSYRDHLWALPATPGSLALIWNKKMFREAGLDPERPPRSIAELEEYNAKLIKRRPDGRLQTGGFLPADPGWWSEMWGLWYGGRLWDGRSRITANSPENIAAYEWIESYPQRFGGQNLLAFRDGFGNFASAQNPFFSGRLAMVLQGPWIYNFIKNFAPADFEWGVASFPSVDPEKLTDVTLVELDALAIPSGARHPKEAFEFIRYVNSQGPMEKLCLAQRKFSPLRDCSPAFFRDHPNPFIKTFLELAKSPNASFVPQLTTWTSYSNEMIQAFGSIWTGKADARAALDRVEEREQAAFDRSRERWDRQAAHLMQEWSAE